MVNDAQLVDLPTVSRTFPKLPDTAVGRQNILDALDTILAGETHAVFIEGVEGIGKTILLAQYALRYSESAVSLFIRPASRLAYATEYLRLSLWVVSRL